MPSAFFSAQTRYGAIRAIRNAALGLLLSAGAALAGAPVTVLALGDSLTAGYGLPEGSGLVPQLQGWLAARGIPATVVNAGVSGDTTAGGLSRLDWSLSPEVGAMIVNLGGNDMLRGIDPGVSRANLDAILTEAGRRHLPVLLVGLRAPGNYGPDYARDFDAIFPDLATRHGADLFPDYFAPLVAEAGDPAARARLMQPDGIHPSAEGVARIVAALGPQVEALVARAEARPALQPAGN